jgi:hypothetical protein
MSPLKLMLVIPAALAAGSALAQEPAKPPAFDAGNYPPEVRKALRYADEECARQEGGAVTFAPDTVRKVDLTGDGRDDYIVDFRDTVCADREAAYCGTGGCIMDNFGDAAERSGSPRVRWPCPHLRNPTGRRRPHHTLRAAWRILRRPRQPVLHQRAPHHGDAVWV